MPSACSRRWRHIGCGRCPRTIGSVTSTSPARTPPCRGRSTRSADEGETLDEGRCAELYERFFVRVAEERALLTAGKRLNELASRADREVGGVRRRDGAVRHLAERGAGAGQRGAHRRADPLDRAGMVEETQRMQDQASQVEGSLRASMAEIDGAAARPAGGLERGAHRRPHRRRQPQAFRPGAAARGGPGARAGRAGLPAAGRHRPLQAVQRPLRPRPGRPGAAAGGQPAQAQRQGPGPGGALRRRGVRGHPAGDPACRRQRPWPTGCASWSPRGAIQLKDRGQTLGRVTLSIGVAEFRPGERCADWIARADAALYEAKHEGRNRVVAARDAAARPRGSATARVACG